MYFDIDGTMTITKPFPFLTTQPMGGHPTVLANVEEPIIFFTYNTLMFSIKKYIHIYWITL